MDTLVQGWTQGKLRNGRMCGIAGIYSTEGRVDSSRISVMLASLSHRGPDDHGQEVLETGRLALGHRRLSIIDLSPLGHQPMQSPSGRSWIVFNGEIYNYREIRSELEALGHSFRSHSDTEVILVAAEQWGIDCVRRFRGMFAFALWHSLNRELHLVRDRFGVKPLYYAVAGKQVAFASELKALHAANATERRIDPLAVSEYVRFGYISAPRTIFADVSSVEPGTILTFDSAGRRQQNRYWSFSALTESSEVARARRTFSTLDREALLDQMEDTLVEGFKYRMVADVPVGLFLSGGIDSTLVATLLAKKAGFDLNTYTIGYQSADFDETLYAKRVADQIGATHTEFTVSSNEALALYDRLPEIADEPIGDSSLIPTLMVSELARRYVPVALSADGADELFGGYARYRVCGRFADRINGISRWGYYLSGSILDRLPRRIVVNCYQLLNRGGPRYADITQKIRKFARMSKSPDVFSAYMATVSEWSESEARVLYKEHRGAEADARAVFDSFHQAEQRERFFAFDTVRYLPGDLLTKVDRASMAVSLEAREPFLDHKIAEAAVALPLSWKIKADSNKYVLQEILSRYYENREFARPKQGFSAPIGDWLRGPLREQMQDELSAKSVESVGILDGHAVEAAVTGFLQGRGNASPAGIWFLLQLQRWASRWLPAPMSL